MATRAQRIRADAIARRKKRTEELERLRHLVVGPAAARIDVLESEARVTPDDVAHVLPEAVARTTDERKDPLAIALEPVVSESLTSFARREEDLFAEILAPSIGAAVRKAVADAFSALLARLDTALENSLTLESIRWRIEAKRTGRPFAEVALLRTLRYRVEQALLIHTPTSLVLGHVTDPATKAQPPDQVAAMLAAIDAFGHEALGPLPKAAHLERFRFGELTVFVRADSEVTLVAVVRGVAPLNLDEQLRAVEERIRLTHQKALEAFDGTISAFTDAVDELTALLRSERRPPSKRGKALVAAAALVIAFILIAFVGHAIHRRTIDRELEHAYASALSSEPGIVLTHTEWKRGRGRFEGFRDPLAADPNRAIARRGLAPLPAGSIALRPFVSDDPRLAVERLERTLEPPPGVGLITDGPVLRMVGTAPQAWIDNARRLSSATGAFERIDDRDLRSDESVSAARSAAADLDNVHIRFRTGSAELGPSATATLHIAAEKSLRALDRARLARVPACIEVVGHADPTGTEEANEMLRVRRARAVEDGLARLGVPRAALSARPGAPSERARAEVTLHIDFACEVAP